MANFVGVARYKLSRMPKVSIIMPVYNAAAYLKASVGTVLEQTYRDIELICFNDASTDSSLDILKNFAAADDRVKIIDSKINVKQGGGRNRALAAASGDYVMFIDADDALAPDAVAICVETAERESADMVVFDFARWYPSSSDRLVTVSQLGADAAELSGDNLRRRIIDKATPVWSAMYRRSLIVDNGLFFPEKVFYEDNAVALAMQLSAAVPVKINRALYHYRCDNVSVSRSTDNYRFFDRMRSAVTLLDHMRRLGIYDRFNDELDYVFINQYLVHTIYGTVYRFSRVPMLRHSYCRRTVGRYIGDFRANRLYRAQPLKAKIKLELHLAAPRLMKTLSRIKRGLIGGK